MRGGGLKTALVIGGAGFVGRHLIPKLQADGYTCLCVDPRSKFDGRSFQWWLLNYRAVDFDVVVHLAANIHDVHERMKGGPSQYRDMALDLMVAEYVAACPPRECFVWPTSCAVDYAADPYAFCKIAGENIFGSLIKQGVKVKMLRPFSGYGEDQALSYPFPAIVDRAIRGEDPLTVWGSGKQVRDFLHIDDLTDAFMLALTDAWPVGEPIDVGTGIGTDFLTLAGMIAEAVGYNPDILPLTDKAESSPRRVADTRKAEAIGFRPRVTLGAGIARAVAAKVACTR